MAEDSEEDSIPSNECKKVNDASALGRGGGAMCLSLRKARHQSAVIFPQEIFFLFSFAQRLVFCGKVVEMGYRSFI